MDSISKKIIFSFALVTYFTLFCTYSPDDLAKINEKTRFEVKQDIILEVITPERLAQIPPDVINNILENDTTDLHFTHYIIQNITERNLNDLTPITIRRLIQKAGKDASNHILKIFEGHRELLIHATPDAMSQFIDKAGSDYALSLAKLIKADMLSNTKSLIPPETVTILIQANSNAARHIMTLITRDNLVIIDGTIKQALKNKLGNEWQEHLKNTYAQVEKVVPVKQKTQHKKTFLQKIGLGKK